MERPRTHLVALLTLCFLVSGFAVTARADFSAAWDPTNWTTTENLPLSDAFVDTSGAPLSILIQGADDGNGAQSILFEINAISNATVSFDWTYSSTDTGAWDRASFMLNGVETQLADNSGSPAAGTFNQAVLAGDLFGFGVFSVDSLVGPGTLTISAFSVIPEPATGLLVCLGLASLGLRGRRSGPVGSLLP